MILQLFLHLHMEDLKVYTVIHHHLTKLNIFHLLMKDTELKLITALVKQTYLKQG